MADTPPRWVARLVSSPGTDAETLLAAGLGLDVWERHGDELVVAATDAQLAEVQRRRLATVQRLAAVEAFENRPPTGGTSDQQEER